MSSSRVIMRIEITPEARNGLDSLVDRRGMIKVAVMSRLVEWFSRQPSEVQQSILSRFESEAERDFAKQLLSNKSA
jgi:hypothetical protein